MESKKIRGENSVPSPEQTKWGALAESGRATKIDRTFALKKLIFYGSKLYAILKNLYSRLKKETHKADNVS